MKKEKEAKLRKKYREIIITPGVRGFQVTVGCSKVYYSLYPDLLRDLARYYNAPYEVEKEFLDFDCRFNGVEPATHVDYGTTRAHETSVPLHTVGSSFSYTDAYAGAGSLANSAGTAR